MSKKSVASVSGNLNQKDPTETIGSASETWLLPPPPAPPKKRIGLYVDVDLDELVNELYVSPFVGKWARDVVEELLRSHAPALSDRIKSSGVRDQ